MSPRRRGLFPALLLALALPASATAGVDLRTTASQVINGESMGDRLGQSVAVAGDVGPLGMHFVLLGAPFADPNGRANAGAAYLVNAGTMEPQLSLKGATRLAGAAAGDQTGTSVASAGDVNGDGVPDVIVGAPFADPPGRRDGGAAYVIFGGSTAPVDLAALGARGFRIDGPAGDAEAGMQVAAAGDVNGDGRADLLVSAPRIQNGRDDLLGAVYIVFGKADSASVDLANLGASGFSIRPTGNDPSFAPYGIAGGVDVSGDGIPDLAFSTSANGDEGTGAGRVLFGARLTPPTLGWSFGGGLGGALNGWSLALAPDINGNSRGELLVGSPGDGCSKPCVGFPGTHQNSRALSGSVFMVFDQASGASVNLSPTAPLPGLRIYGPQIGSGAGTSVASAGDMNGDGRADIALGAPGTVPAYVPKGPRTPGAAYVVYARTKPGIIDLAKLGASGFSFRGAGLGDRTGDSIAAGPLGTRDPQLVVGAPRAHNLRGAVYVVPPVPVLVSDRSIRVSRSGRASVTLRCVASARCSAIVEIHSLASGRLIGRRAYSVNSGSTRTKQIKLTSAGLRELRRTGKLRVSVAALTPKQTRSGGNTLSTATLTLLSPR